MSRFISVKSRFVFNKLSFHSNADLFVTFCMSYSMNAYDGLNCFLVQHSQTSTGTYFGSAHIMKCYNSGEVMSLCKVEKYLVLYGIVLFHSICQFSCYLSFSQYFLSMKCNTSSITSFCNTALNNRDFLPSNSMQALYDGISWVFVFVLIIQ